MPAGPFDFDHARPSARMTVSIDMGEVRGAGSAASCQFDLEELLACGRVRARRAAQGLDEAHQRRQRRAQLVADIGDEIAAHLLGLLVARAVLDRHRRADQPRRPQGRDRHLAEHPPVGRAQGDDQPRPLLPGQHGVQRGIHLGVAQHGDKGPPARHRAQKRLGRLVRADDARMAVHRQHGHRHAAQQRVQPLFDHPRATCASPWRKRAALR